MLHSVWFRVKCLKQGMKNRNSVLNRVGKSTIFVLNRVRVWGAGPHLPTQGYIEYPIEGLKTVQPNSFSKFISAVCNFKNNAQETCLFVSNLWLCYLHVISFFTLKFHSDWGRGIAKIKQNELDCRDTVPLGRLLLRMPAKIKQQTGKLFPCQNNLKNFSAKSHMWACS